MPDRSFLAWPFFEERHRALAAEIGRLSGISDSLTDHADVDATCRSLVRRLADAGTSAPHRAGGLRRCERAARCSDALSGARDARPLRRARRLRLRHAGPGIWRHQPVRQRGAAPRLPSRRRARPQDRSLRAVRGSGRLRRRGDRHDRHGRRHGLRPERRQDLDLERRHRRLLRRVRAHRRGPRRQGPVRLHRRCRHAGPHDRRAHRADRAASARDPALRGLPRAARGPARRARPGLSDRDGDARCVPPDGRSGGAGLRPPRARRDPGARQPKGSCSAARSPSCRWSRASSPTWRWRSMPRHSWSIAPPGPRIPAPSGSPARRRWPSFSPPRQRRR